MHLSSIFLLIFFLNTAIYSQGVLFSNIPVSDAGTNNNIGSSNTSRNVGVDDKGNIFVVYTNNTEVRLAKSVNGGQSFLPSTLVSSSTIVEPELNINKNGNIYIAWVQNNDLFFTSSINEGLSFSTPRIIGTGSRFGVHISSFEKNVYLINQNGKELYANTNNGVGDFTRTSTGKIMQYADVLTDQNGIIYTPMDDPNLFIFESINQGITLTNTIVNPAGAVYFSSYALSDGPCGTFIFVGGGQNFPSETLGYKIDVKTGFASQITLGKNSISAQGRTLYADNRGTLIDGYRNDSGFLVMNVSSDQGTTFNAPIIVAEGDSHNIARSPITDNILVTYQANGQIFLSVYNNLLKNIEIPIPSTPLILCSDDSFDLPYNISGLFNANTILSVSLSDEFGDFNNATEIGSITTNNSGSIACNIPTNLPSSTQYRIQIESIANCIQSNSINVTLEKAIITGDSKACVGNTIQLTGTDNPNKLIPWQSSNTTVATINNLGLLTALSSGTTEITYSTNGNCSTTFLIEVFDNPDVTKNVSILKCDDDNDGFTFFDLTTANSSIIDTTNIINITYFKTYENAKNNITPIVNFTNYENTIADIDSVWARIENINGCYNVSEIKLLINLHLEYEIKTVDNSNNNSISIKILTQDLEELEYSLLDGLGTIYEFQTIPFFYNLKTGTYTVLIRYKNACNTTQEEVSLLEFPKFFTPNGDGTNDFWQIKGMSENFYQSGKINIFDRFGNPIISFSVDDLGWNGNYNGKVLASNDYWFFAELIDAKNIKRTQSGHFSLVRK